MSKRHNLQLSNKRLAMESLEARQLLSGFDSVAPSPASQHAAIVSTSNKSPVTTVAAKSTEVHLTAVLANTVSTSTMTSNAQYESETEHGVVVRQLAVNVKGGTPNDVINVTITTTVGTTSTVLPIGKITVAADGTGQLKLSPTAPEVAANSVISFSVTDKAGLTKVIAKGTFVASVETHDSSESETELMASLADTKSTLKSTAQYESETEHGLVVSKLNINITGAVAGAVIDATIDGKSVGTITIGANGVGQLKLTTNVPTITTKSILTLSAVTKAANGSTILTPIVSGTFAAPPPKK